MKNRSVVIYIHGKGGNAAEAEHYKPLFKDSDVYGLEYKSQTPWEAKEEFPKELDKLSRDCNSVTLIANSIGAYLAMASLSDKQITKAFFISPIANMEKLILNMMAWASVTEKELCERKEIATDFGEVLSWEYLQYVRAYPVKWNIPTCILYGENDNLTDIKTITELAESISAPLTVMRGGEHWFHTHEQMLFLDKWISSNK